MFTDLLTALAVVINGIPQGILALSFGFAAFPTAIAFLVGIAGSLAFNSVATISFQAETITLAGTMGRNVRERLSLVFWGGIFLLIPSVLGMNEAIVAFIGPTIGHLDDGGRRHHAGVRGGEPVRLREVFRGHVVRVGPGGVVHHEGPGQDDHRFRAGLHGGLQLPALRGEEGSGRA